MGGVRRKTPEMATPETVHHSGLTCTHVRSMQKMLLTYPVPCRNLLLEALVGPDGRVIAFLFAPTLLRAPALGRIGLAGHQGI